MRGYVVAGIAALGIGFLGGYASEVGSRLERQRRDAARLGFERLTWFVERDSVGVSTYMVLDDQLFSLQDYDGDGVLDERCFTVGDVPLTRRVRACYEPTAFDRAVYDWVEPLARLLPEEVPHVARPTAEGVGLVQVSAPSLEVFK